MDKKSGENGKFGLILKKKDESKNKPTFVNNFDNDEDEDQVEYIKKDSFNFNRDINKNIRIQQQYNSLKLADKISENLLSNSDVFEYDKLYDDFSNSKRLTKRINNKDDDKPKYLDAILASTERRRIEQSIIRERVEKKKREREEGDFGDKPKFVTKGYEEKLRTNKKYELNLSLEEKYNEKNTVNSEIGMMGFYSNLLTKNVDCGESLQATNKFNNLNMLSTQEQNIKSNPNHPPKFNLKNESEINLQRKLKQNEKVIPNIENDKIDSNSVSPNNATKIDEVILDKGEKKEKNEKQEDEEILKTENIEDYKKRYLERKRNRNINENNKD